MRGAGIQWIEHFCKNLSTTDKDVDYSGWW
ncbi:hypothetical protein N750_17470 [Legionella pneumophila str. Leg01/53]|nr:hypothetical protein N750_17470 [Legionella pneumophila str. Leg01/53]ERI46675.1 hypothetical protein N749_17065 [Legionella pneumophila str. Leg01/20]